MVTSTATNPAHTPTHFFDLPAELRLHFYQEVISQYDTAAILRLPLHDEGRVRPLLNTWYHLPLLNSCQRFRKEALRLWLKYLRTLRDSTKTAHTKVLERIGKHKTEHPHDHETLDELRATESDLYEAFSKLEAMHFADHCTAFDSGIQVARISEEDYEKQGYRELLDWLLAHW